MLSTAVVAEGNLLIPTIPDLLWGTIVFVIILVFFIVKGLPAINKLLDERRDAIDGGIQRAEKAQADANAVLERYTAQLAEAWLLTPPEVSRHLSVLKNAGVITSTRHGRYVSYELDLAAHVRLGTDLIEALLR